MQIELHTRRPFGASEEDVGGWHVLRVTGEVDAATGGEGEVSRTVEDVLGRFGWSHRALSTDEDHPSHLGLDESPPPPDHGERMAPVPPSDEEQRAAHEAAAAERARKAG